MKNAIASTCNRPNLYANIHKGIRLLLSDLAHCASRTDFQDPRSVAALVERCDDAFSFLEGHAHHESAFIGPVLATARPDVHATIELAHHQQEDQLADLRRRLVALDPHRDDAAPTGHRLVLALTRIVGELLDHMADEEEIVMPALWAALDDAAIDEVHQRILASIPPAEMMVSLRWMLPALNHPERVELLTGAAEHAPPPVFAAMLEIARAHLTTDDVARLEAALVPPSQRAA